MDKILRWLFPVIVFVQCASCVFFHENSAILVKSAHTNPSSEFGFSLGYWDQKLVVGSPNSTLDGDVYTCPISDISEDINCATTIDVNINVTHSKRIQVLRDLNPDQHFYLGGTISTTTNYVFFCAPLVTKRIQKSRSDKLDAPTGTCFYHFKNGSTEVWKGIDDRYVHSRVNGEKIISGVGWKSLADEINGFVIVPMIAETSEINYFSMATDRKKVRLASFDSKELHGKRNIGYGLVAGTFFSDKTVYAVSMQDEKLSGQIMFLGTNDHRQLELVKTENDKPVVIIHGMVAVNFGYELAAADLNLDGYSELLVGAPTQPKEINGIEHGALHIYLGSDDPSKWQRGKKYNMRTIFGLKELGRFGSTIASSDIDGDNIPEIFVSAPFEDTGVVYLLPGHDIKGLLKSVSVKEVSLTQIKNRQRIMKSDLHRLGFSIHILPDLNSNGCKEIAIGAPGSASVVVLESFQTLHVNVSSRLIGTEYVREQDLTFIANVCVKVIFRTKSTKVNEILKVTNTIFGPNAKVDIPEFNVDLSKNVDFSKDYDQCENITVTFKTYLIAEYNLKTVIHLEDEVKKHNNTVFDPTWAVLSLDSVIETNLNVKRFCKVECEPKLNITMQWEAGEIYELGSSKAETVRVKVRNDGFAAYGACVRINVAGAHVSRVKGSHGEAGSYTRVLNSLQRDTNETLDIELNMQRLSDEDSSLVVDATLYENCNQKTKEQKETFTIPYSNLQQRDYVYLSGKRRDLLITDKNVQDKEIQSFENYHTYSIENNGSIIWKKSYAVIHVNKTQNGQELVKKVVMILKDSNIDHCSEENNDDNFKINCTVTLEPGHTVELNPTLVLSKEGVGNFLSRGQQIQVTSELALYLAGKVLQEPYRVLSEIKLKKELSLGNNPTLVILMTVFISLLLLATIVFFLYKRGFFKRAEKKKLDVLRESVRRRSVRLASESRKSHRSTSAADSVKIIDHAAMELGDDSAFGDIEVKSNDNNLISVQAEVHPKPSNVN